ncbi:hypothetical protein HWC59_gp57 [Proteus phage Myduc]|uniref:Uncharacterized protein n=1 Tax=Proteus phage Myduc TaxID=2650874 RepID=A0A5J6T7E5_9CAUD|nr:hypothetical protein HWC59_gp57 [Proteus phage Myduc]QFG06680.1 hypothetical protein CPT_Myduc_058 [Proteus phage Myduc]
MKVINKSQGNMQFFYTAGKGDTATTEYVHLPAGVEAEIDDAIWKKITAPLTKVQDMKRVERPTDSVTPITMDKNPLTIVDYEPTGKTKEVNLVLEKVKKGLLEIVEDVERSIEEKSAFLNKQGIPVKDMSEEQINAMFKKLS